MKTFGLTGGIGMGKSAAAKLLLERGVAVIDTDLIARQVVEPDQPALRELASVFGAEIIGRDSRLIREKLAEIVFADAESRRQLEAILHPRIREAWLHQLELRRAEGAPLIVAVIPLLFETNATAYFDATVCVACSARTQEERLRNRGWTIEQIEQRRRAQWPSEKKMNAADYVVWTEGSLEIHAAQLGRII
ncbi:MAG: dephospho-CoA kinase [Verrucomicrobia bacterium]|nr:dephospho-CoA kinase [Verrucomicrobiota bacterium]